MNKYSIYGAIIGDIVGSKYEVDEVEAKLRNSKVTFKNRIKILDKATPLFSKSSSFTDDSILTCAIADAILCDDSFENKLRDYGKREIQRGIDLYGRSRFGSGFTGWIEGIKPNTSVGNGCAMRISPVAYAYDTFSDTMHFCDMATITSHNSPEALKCARSVCGAIFMAIRHATKEEIKVFCENTLLLKLDYKLEDLQKNYIFSSTALNSVPQAIYCFLISNGFEDCLRKSISIGGDSDTIAAISCAIAGAFYGVPKELLLAIQEYLPDEYKIILEKFATRYCFDN